MRGQRPFCADPPAPRRKVVIELADRPDAGAAVKRFEEEFEGDLTSFLVSPTLRQDAESLETAAQMTDRRLRWAREATGGRRVAPARHLLQTSFWAPQRPELNVKEAEVLGVKPGSKATTQPGEYRVRGRLNDIPHLDRIAFEGAAGARFGPGFGVIGLKTDAAPSTGSVVGRFSDGSPAAVENAFGKGRTLCVAAAPGISYIKDAKFVPAELREKWPAAHRRFINAWARTAGAVPAVGLSSPVVEAGVYEGPAGVALVLANFTYEPVEKLRVRLPVRTDVKQVRAADAMDRDISFERLPADELQRQDGFTGVVSFEIPLGLDQIVMVR